MKVSYTTAFRLLYGGCWIYAALAAVKLAGVLPGVDFTTWPILLQGGCTSTLCLTTQIVMLFTNGCLYAAASQMVTTHAQKKVLQYTMVQPLVELGLIASEFKAWNIGMVPPLLHVLYCCVFCYGLAPKADKQEMRLGAKSKRLSRFLYSTLFLYACATVFYSPARPEIYGSSASKFCMAFSQSWLFGAAAALMAAAQIDGESARKLLQYFLVLPLLQVFVVYPLQVATAGKSAVVPGCADMCLYYAMLTLLVCVLYPSTLRTFILRASYLFYLFAAIVWGVFPKAGPLLFGFDVPATATHIVAVLFTFLGLLLIAAVQTDVGLSQYRIVEYTLVGDLLLLALAAAGYRFGTLLPLVAAKSAIAKAVDVYCEKKDKPSPKLCGLFVEITSLAEGDDEEFLFEDDYVPAAPKSMKMAMKKQK